MNVKVDDLMSRGVMSTHANATVGQVRRVMSEHRVNGMPVVNDSEEPVGIVTATDILDGGLDDQRVSQVMSDKVITVPQYADPSLAARIMRNHHLHHLLVTHEKKLVGILSSFDLLRLVEDHRFVMKNPPTETKRKGGKRKKSETG